MAPPSLAIIVRATLAMCALGSLGAAAVTPAKPDDRPESSHHSMTSADLIALSLVALDKREASLQNCSFRLTETTTNIERTDESIKRFMSTDEYEFRRTARCTWMRVVSHWVRPPHEIAAVSTFNWDGTSARGIGDPEYLHISYPPCSVGPKENRYFTSIRYFEILGFRTDTNTTPMSLAGWLRGELDGPNRVEAAVETFRGNDAIHLKVVERGGYLERGVWLDPAKGFIVCGTDYLYRGPGNRFDTFVHRLVESAQVSGVWIPTKSVRVDESSSYHEKTESVFTVDGTFNIGTTSEADVEVAFPVGAKVVDSIRHIAYFIRPNGKFELIDLANTDERVIHVRPEKPVVDRIDAGTAGLYRTEQIRPGTVANGAGIARLSRVRRIAMVSSVVAALLLSLIWIRGRRRTARAPRPGV